MPNHSLKIQPTERSLVQSMDLPFIQQGQNILIDARLLHNRLKAGTKFNDWIIRKIKDFGFEKDVDYYYSNLSKDYSKNQYYLTLDMAKELAMLERNETGRAIRRYFIEKEKEARGISHLPQERGLFAGMKPQRIQERTLYPYREVLVRCGYKANNNGGRRHRYPQHFVLVGDRLFVTQEFALHLYRQKQVFNNRAVLQAMQPVLALDFKEGGHHV